MFTRRIIDLLNSILCAISKEKFLLLDLHNFRSILFTPRGRQLSAYISTVKYSVFFTDGLRYRSGWIRLSRWSSFRDIRLHTRIKGETSGIARIRWNKQTIERRNRLCTRGRKIRDVTCRGMHPPRIWFHWNVRGSIMLRFFHSIVASSSSLYLVPDSAKKERFAIDKLASKFFWSVCKL